jgi:hypothetical protein
MPTQENYKVTHTTVHIDNVENKLSALSMDLSKVIEMRQEALPMLTPGAEK